MLSSGVSDCPLVSDSEEIWPLLAKQIANQRSKGHTKLIVVRLVEVILKVSVVVKDSKNLL